jgi:hypothetical protein
LVPVLRFYPVDGELIGSSGDDAAVPAISSRRRHWGCIANQLGAQLVRDESAVCR